MADDKLTLHDADPDDFNGLRDQIVNLAGQGYSAHYISKAIGVNYPKVCKILKSEFQDRCANRQNVIESLDQNLHWLQVKVSKAVADSVEGKNAKLDLKAGELYLKIVDRRARLHGADQPVQHEVTVSHEEFTADELIEQLRLNGLNISLPAGSTTSLPEHVQDAEYSVLPSHDEAQDRP